MIWECPCCGGITHGDPVVGDDWDVGESTAVGPTCETCDEEMEYVPNYNLPEEQ